MTVTDWLESRTCCGRCCRPIKLIHYHVRKMFKHFLQKKQCQISRN